MSAADFASFYETFVNGCTRWKKDIQRMSTREAMDFYNRENIGEILRNGRTGTIQR